MTKFTPYCVYGSLRCRTVAVELWITCILLSRTASAEASLSLAIGVTACITQPMLTLNGGLKHVALHRSSCTTLQQIRNMAAQLVSLPEVERISDRIIRILGGNPGKVSCVHSRARQGDILIDHSFPSKVVFSYQLHQKTCS